MFGRHTTENLLEGVLKDYQQLAGSDIQALRNRINPTEMWRLFVEKHNQQHGRRLKSAKSFNVIEAYRGSSPLALTINQYIEKIEKINLSDPKELKKSKLLKDLRRRLWVLDENSRAKLTLNDLLTLDKAWMPFEINEQGYALAMISALQEIFKPDESLSMDFILKLNFLSTNKVKGTNFDSDLEKRGELRSKKKEMSFLLNKACASEQGLKEFLDRNHPDQAIELSLFDEGDEWLGSVDLNVESLKLIRDFEGLQELSRQPGVELNPDFSRLKKCCKADSVSDFVKAMSTHPVLRRVIGSLGKTKTNEEAAAVLYHWIESHHDYVQLLFVSSQKKHGDEWSEKLKQELNGYIIEYLKVIKNQTQPIDKLKVIINFIQACELQHPFHDANGRTFCMLLLNYLLIQEGFPLAILNDSNHFNLYSQDEMLREIVKGMANTMKLIKDGKLFDIDTQDILRELKANPHFQDFFTYFQEVVAIEEQGRRAQKTPDFKH